MSSDPTGTSNPCLCAMHPALACHTACKKPGNQTKSTSYQHSMKTWSRDGPYAARMRPSVSLQAMEVTARPCSRSASCSIKLPAITPTYKKCPSAIANIALQSIQAEVSKNKTENWHVGAYLAPELIEEQQIVLHLCDDVGPQAGSTPVLLLIAGTAATSLY